MQPLANHAPGAQARLGTTLSGKWRLDKVLGVGGVATVFLATHRNKSRAALKLLHPEQAQNPTVRERFVHEGYVANSIDHPGVVRVIDDDVSQDGLPYLVMELLEGETLEDRAYRLGGRLPPGEVLALMDQLLGVLIAAHDRRVVHRDLKPDNLFLTREGLLKVLDFGIARLTEAMPQRDVTAVGTLLGTPTYMPPEQARSRWEEVDAQSDLYSVGATMFSLLTGSLVRDAETLTEQLALAIHEPAPKLATADKTLDQALCALVDKALAYEKKQRFPDARAMQVELRRVRESIPPPLTSSVNPLPLTMEVTARTISPDSPTLLESGRVVVRTPAPRPEDDKPITIAIERRFATTLLLGLLVGAALLIWLYRGSSARDVPSTTSGSAAVRPPTPPRAQTEAPSRPEPPATAAPPAEAATATAATEGSAPGSTSTTAAKTPRAASPGVRATPAALGTEPARSPVSEAPATTPPSDTPPKRQDPFSNRY